MFNLTSQKNKTSPILFRRCRSGHRAFTLFEALVSIAIFTILTSVLLVKNNQFRGTTALNNLSYEIALIVRQAQVYGLSVTKDVESTGDQAFQRAYGIHVPLTGSNSQFMFFVDRNNNSVYDPGAGPGVPGDDLELFTLRNGTTIYKVCLDIGLATERCTAILPDASNHIEVLFRRPLPDARFRGVFGTITYSSASNASIFLRSNSGLCREVYVTSAGQIGVHEVVASSLCN